MGLVKKGIVFVALAIQFLQPAAAEEIHDASQRGDYDRVRELLEKNSALVDQKDSSWGRTPLHWAAHGGHFDVIRLLVKKGADVNAADNSGGTALHAVASRGHMEAAKYLIGEEADINPIDASGRTPLACAVTGSHQGLVEWLVSRGAFVPIGGEEGRRLFHAAASRGDRPLVEWMVARGVDFSSENGNGGSLLHSASEGGLTGLIDKLIEKGFAVNESCRYGLTPLHYAAAMGHKEAAVILLKNKADVDAATLAGERPLHLSRKSGRESISRYLMARGAATDPPAFPDLRGEYLGQKKPGGKVELFGLGIISSKDWEHAAPDFSPDGKEVYWTSISDRMRILRMVCQEGKWTAPELAPFTGVDGCYPRFSRDGTRLYYISYRPLKAGEKNPGFGVSLWYVERTETGWSEPRPVGPPVNTGNIFGFSLTADNTLYYADGGGASFDIFRSKFFGGKYTEPERLGEAVNSPYAEDEPFVAPDESYIIFKSMRPGGFGGADLYICFRQKAGSWTTARNLGPMINTPYAERFPSVTRDGRFFFFGSDRNGNRGDIYWTDARFIAGLKPKNLKKN